MGSNCLGLFGIRAYEARGAALLLWGQGEGVSRARGGNRKCLGTIGASAPGWNIWKSKEP